MPLHSHDDMQEICLNGSLNLNEYDYIQHLKRAHKAKFIVLKNCENITNQVLSYVHSSCVYLDISLSDSLKDEITDIGLDACFQKIDKLESLNLSGRKNITDAPFENIPLSLKFLILPGKAAKYISDHTLQKLAQRAPNLKYLYLNESNFKFTCSDFFIKSLEHCDMSFAPRISDETFQLMPYMPTLKSLNLNGCTYLTDFALYAIVNKCRNLEKISLSYCPYITDRGVKTIITKCKTLQYLCLSHCSQLSDFAFIGSIHRNEKLRKLNLLGCKKISTSFVSFLKIKKPSLHVYS